MSFNKLRIKLIKLILLKFPKFKIAIFIAGKSMFFYLFFVCFCCFLIDYSSILLYLDSDFSVFVLFLTFSYLVVYKYDLYECLVKSIVTWSQTYRHIDIRDP